MKKRKQGYVPMRIQARSGSYAERDYLQSGLPSGWGLPAALARGIDPSPLDDLIYHGGKVVPQMEFQNVYLGGSSVWKKSDIRSIDSAITLAMRAKRLNNVVAQYFPGSKLSCDVRQSFIVPDAAPARLDEPDVQRTVIDLYERSLISKSDLDTCIFNLILPPGVVLKLGTSTSLRGLGGYHGSVHFKAGGKKRTLYYSANVYSEFLEDGTENGIVAFNRPWKNVVGTLYHEINEFRTDADVNDAIEKNDDDFLGWNSRRGSEIGDQPIFATEGNLKLVFKEVSVSSSRKVPVQFLYSNAVHGAEGPIKAPHSG
ncbi:MAG: hypothetical protein QM756_33505 [Polyangiaceae bacterium]